MKWAILLLLPLVAWSEEGPVKPEFEISRALIDVVWYATEEEIYEALNLNRRVRGVSECVWDEEHNLAKCTIHVVRPTVVNGDRTRIVGHELLHAFWGFYHDQPVTFSKKEDAD